jgi:hypothetical protein
VEGWNLTKGFVMNVKVSSVVLKVPVGQTSFIGPFVQNRVLYHSDTSVKSVISLRSQGYIRNRVVHELQGSVAFKKGLDEKGLSQQGNYQDLYVNALAKFYQFEPLLFGKSGTVGFFIVILVIEVNLPGGILDMQRNEKLLSFGGKLLDLLFGD